MQGRIKNRILKVFISIVFIIWTLSIFTYDSWQTHNYIIFAVTTVLLGTFIHVNKEYLDNDR
jgi:hypothetical protein